MKYFKKIEGDRLYLSPMNPEDYELYTKWLNDLKTTTCLGNVTSTFGLNVEKEAIERFEKEGNHFAIIKKDTDELLGNCSLFDINHIHDTCEIGIFIGEETDRGKGYGPEAMELILSYGFRILNLNNIMLNVASFNSRGIMAYEKIGFKEMGRRSEAIKINNKKYDRIFMEILNKNFVNTCYNENFPDHM